MNRVVQLETKYLDTTQIDQYTTIIHHNIIYFIASQALFQQTVLLYWQKRSLRYNIENIFFIKKHTYKYTIKTNLPNQGKSQ